MNRLYDINRRERERRDLHARLRSSGLRVVEETPAVAPAAEPIDSGDCPPVSVGTAGVSSTDVLLGYIDGLPVYGSPDTFDPPSAA